LNLQTIVVMVVPPGGRSYQFTPTGRNLNISKEGTRFQARMRIRR